MINRTFQGTRIDKKYFDFENSYESVKSGAKKCENRENPIKSEGMKIFSLKNRIKHLLIVYSKNSEFLRLAYLS
jgi:hypothetical protein